MLLTFAQTDFTCDPLKTSVAITHFNLILISYSLNQFSSYNGLHNEVIRLHLTHCNTILDDIIQEDQTSLVTIDKYPLTLIIFTSHTYTVSIGVAGHYDISIDLLRQSDSHRKCLSIFRIRRYHCREITILHHLLGYTIYIFKSPFFQRGRNQNTTCTMQRSINNAEIFLTLDHFRIDRNRMNHIQIDLIHISTDNLNQIFVAFKLNVGNCHLIYFIDNSGIVRSKYLCTIIPISLITVVFSRIVACSDIDTTLATEVTDSKRNFRCRTQIIEEIYFDTVCREDICRNLSKLVAVVAAVITYHHRNLLFILEALVQIVRKSLCSSTYRVNIHTIGSCAHNTAQTTRSEFQILIKAIYQFGFIFVLQHAFHFRLSFGIISRGEPSLGFLSYLFDKFLIFHIIIVILEVKIYLLFTRHKCRRISSNFLHFH